MEPKLGALASRIRSQIEEEEGRRRREEDERKRTASARREADAKLARQRAEAQAARAALLDEIAAFAEAVGHLDTTRDGPAVELSFRSRSVRFEPEGDHDRIGLVVPGETPRNHFIGRDEQGVWEVVIDEGSRIRRHPLEQGLVEVLKTMLEVPISDELPPEPEKGKGRKSKKGKAAPPGSELRELKDPLG